MNGHQTASDNAAASAAQAAPALTAIYMWFTGKDINFFVGVAGLFFIGLQCGYLLWKWNWQRELRRMHQAPPKGAEE